MHLVHLSDIHIWRFVRNPLHLLGKRVVGQIELATGRARRFRLERLGSVVDRVLALAPDHILITGDLTTTALPAEFEQARTALGRLLTDPDRVTILPGNHDRYVHRAVRERTFERAFGAFAPAREYPWLRWLDRETAIMGLDPTRAHLTARGYLPKHQLEKARALVADAGARLRRLVVACHYPLAAPARYKHELAHKRLVNAAEVIRWLGGIGPHLYCCGHVHAAWAFQPPELPEQLCLNAGAPLLRDRTGARPPGFLGVELHENDSVSVIHHAWLGAGWEERLLVDRLPLFSAGELPPRTAQ